MIKDIIFNFLDYIEERFNFMSKDLQLVMCYETYIEFYYGMAVRKDEEALPGLIYILKDKIVLGVFKII